jgi:hypothetical protein
MLMDEQTNFAPGDSPTPPEQPQPEINPDSITWTASEFVNNAKNLGWYLMFIVAILIICAAVYLFTHSIFSSIVIFVLGLALCFMAGRRPKELDYGLDDQGIIINGTDYPFSEFKSYTLVTEGGLDHIALISIKRFISDKTIYFEPQDRDRIISLLGEFLPLEPASKDPIDGFMKRIGL